MQENNKKRIRLTENSDFVWSQRNKLEKRADKNAHSNTVQNDNILYRNAKAAKQAEDKLYAEKMNAAEKETGKKLTAKRLRELRGLSKKQIKRRDLAQVRREREQSATRTNMARTIRKRDDYTR